MNELKKASKKLENMLRQIKMKRAYQNVWDSPKVMFG